MIQNLIAILIILVVIACGSSRQLLQPTEKDVARMSAGKKQITFEELQDGYNLYIANCSGCHSLHVPSSKTEKQWEIILPKMVLKAKLNIHEQELIRNYIYSKL